MAATSDFGTDLSCVSDFTSTMSTVSGRRLVGEAIARRLQTPRGRLIKHPNYGYDIAGELNGDLDAADIGRIQSNVEAECVKDERVLQATAVVTFAANTLTVVITLVDADGPFALVLAVSEVSVTLLSVST